MKRQRMKLIKMQMRRQKLLSEDILQTAFQKLTISTEVNKDAVDDFAAISLEQKFIDQKPSDDFITEVK